jgi:CubicO group peptidase (beta-lactamase class C family)
VSSLVQRIIDTDPSSPDAPLVQGLLIARHGKLVLEEYFYGFHKELVHDLRSASKSFTSLMMGIALDRGNRLSVSTPVYSLFPEYPRFANADSRKHDMTLEHLLTMSSGFACNDNDESSPGNEDRMYDQTAQPDWYKYTLDLPISSRPGEKAVYCTAGVNLLGGILRNSTKEWLPEFFRRQLAVPLQIRRYYINLMPTGEAYMGGGMRLRPRDALKIGQVFLAGGTWNGKRIISREWIDRSTTKHSAINPESGYGYNWWLHDLRSADGRIFPAYAAEGNGGQLLIVIPKLDLVVMFAGGNYNRYPIWRKFRDELTPQFIIAAVSRN